MFDQSPLSVENSKQQINVVVIFLALWVVAGGIYAE